MLSLSFNWPPDTVKRKIEMEAIWNRRKRAARLQCLRRRELPSLKGYHDVIQGKIQVGH